MRNNILTFNWFTYFVAVNYTACTHRPEKYRETFELFQKYFTKYFSAKNFMKSYIATYCRVDLHTWPAEMSACAETDCDPQNIWNQQKNADHS